jgi:hypothetical protein
VLRKKEKKTQRATIAKGERKRKREKCGERK